MQKQFILAVITAFLLLTGCGVQSGTAATQSSSLTESQKSFLRSQGLSDDPEKLSASQIRNVQRIDAMMQYLNDKYDETFVFLDYYAPELMQSEELVARPLHSDGMTDLITVTPSGNGFTDDYVPISDKAGIFGSGAAWEYVQEQMQEFVENYADKHDLGDTVLYISEVFKTDIRDMSQVQAQEDGTEDFCWEFSCAATCFVYEDECARSELEEMAKAFAEWDYARHIRAQMRFQTLHDSSISMDEITARNMAEYYTVSPKSDPYYMYCVDIFDDRIHDYDNETANGFDYEHQEYFDGGRAEKWFPVTVTDIQYQGETVIDQMKWYTWRNPKDAYFVVEEAEKGTLRFPEINRLLQKAGWTYETDQKSCFGWKKADRTVMIYIEDSDQLNIYGEPKKKWHLEINGEKSDSPIYCDVVARERIPEYQNGEFLVELAFSVETYKELFGIVIEIDQNAADIDHPDATGKVTAVDRY